MSEKHIKRFVAFHTANPQVYELYKRFAFEALEAGIDRLSTNFIMQRIRWEVDIVTRGAGWNPRAGKPFKINDHTAPYFARLFVMDYPMHADKFEFRKIKCSAPKS